MENMEEKKVLLFFHIFHIISLFNLLFFHIFHIFLLFNLPFLPYFPNLYTIQQPENYENRNDSDLVQAVLKKW
jgi:hypothetical protein